MTTEQVLEIKKGVAGWDHTITIEPVAGGYMASDEKDQIGLGITRDKALERLLKRIYDFRRT